MSFLLEGVVLQLCSTRGGSNYSGDDGCIVGDNFTHNKASTRQNRFLFLFKLIHIFKTVRNWITIKIAALEGLCVEVCHLQFIPSNLVEKEIIVI